MFELGRALGLEGWGTFALEPVGAGRTRLIARGGVPRGVGAVAYGMLMEIPHFLMNGGCCSGSTSARKQAERNCSSRVPREPMRTVEAQ